jgi:hypothetical protein
MPRVLAPLQERQEQEQLEMALALSLEDANTQNPGSTGFVGGTLELSPLGSHAPGSQAQATPVVSHPSLPAGLTAPHTDSAPATASPPLLPAPPVPPAASAPWRSPDLNRTDGPTAVNVHDDQLPLTPETEPLDDVEVSPCCV